MTRCFSQQTSVRSRHSHAVGDGESARGAELGQEAILEVDGRLPDNIVCSDDVVVLDADDQILFDGHLRLQLEHSDAPNNAALQI